MARFLGKLPTNAQGVTCTELKVAVCDFGKPAVADPNGLLNVAVAAATAVTITSFLTDLDVPRQVTVVATDATAAGFIENNDVVTIYGTDIEGKAISEVLTFEADQETAETTAYAFKTVAKVIIGESAVGATFDVGWNDALGLPFTLSAVEPRPLEFGGGLLKTTAGVFTRDASVVGKNTYDPNTTLNGATSVELLMFL